MGLDDPSSSGRARERSRRVLIVEDTEDISVILRSLFQDAGYEVAEARDGLAGLSAVTRFRPDVVLLDLGLPLLPGEDVLRELRRRPNCRDLPVVIVTAQRSTPAGLEHLGVSAIIAKPFDLEEVLGVVDQILSEAARPQRQTRGLILAIDDQPTILEVVAEALTEAGYEVITTTDPHEGLGLARGRTPDLIIADLAMPALGGIDLITSLKARRETAAIPVLVATAFPEHLARQDGRVARYGIEVLPKPFFVEELTAAVARLLN